jgi:cold-inducible RNA-binding protein
VKASGHMNDAMSATPNPKKLFVGNLSWGVTEDDLRDAFSPYGDVVDVKLIIDRQTGRSKGIAFVEFAEEAAATAAVDALNGQDLMGRAIVVNVARPFVPRTDRPERSGGYGDDRRGGGGFRGGDRRGGFGGGQRDFGGRRDYGRDDNN